MSWEGCGIPGRLTLSFHPGKTAGGADPRRGAQRLLRARAHWPARTGSVRHALLGWGKAQGKVGKVNGAIKEATLRRKTRAVLTSFRVPLTLYPSL